MAFNEYVEYKITSTANTFAKELFHLRRNRKKEGKFEEEKRVLVEG
jgi:hypothetical protein